LNSLPSINIATRTPLEPLIAACEARIAKLEEEYDAEFFGTTDIRFKDIGEVMPEAPTTKRILPSTPSTPTPQAPSPLPTYANVARPVPLRGTGGMDPIAQQIVAGLAPQFQELKAAITGPKGWEALGESIANVLNRAIQPVTAASPTQASLTTLTSTVSQQGNTLATLSQTVLTQQATIERILTLLKERTPAPAAPASPSFTIIDPDEER
jgi:hypothetical protein